MRRTFLLSNSFICCILLGGNALPSPQYPYNNADLSSGQNVNADGSTGDIVTQNNQQGVDQGISASGYPVYNIYNTNPGITYTPAYPDRTNPQYGNNARLSSNQNVDTEGGTGNIIDQDNGQTANQAIGSPPGYYTRYPVYTATTPVAATPTYAAGTTPVAATPTYAVGSAGNTTVTSDKSSALSNNTANAATCTKNQSHNKNGGVFTYTESESAGNCETALATSDFTSIASVIGQAVNGVNR